MVTKSQDRIEARLAARFALTEAGTKLAKQMKAAARNTIPSRRTARQPRWSPAVRVRVDSRPPNQARVWCT